METMELREAGGCHWEGDRSEAMRGQPGKGY